MNKLDNISDSFYKVYRDSKALNGTVDYYKARDYVVDRENQAYTSLVEGIEGMKSDPTLPVDDALYSRSDIDREVDKTLTDILENVVKPLYNKTGDN